MDTEKEDLFTAPILSLYQRIPSYDELKNGAMKIIENTYTLQLEGAEFIHLRKHYIPLIKEEFTTGETKTKDVSLDDWTIIQKEIDTFFEESKQKRELKPEEKRAGWKFHVSIPKDYFEQIFEPLISLLIKHRIHHAKIAPPSLSVSSGKELTIYAYNEPADKIWRPFIDELEGLLMRLDIKPGHLASGDKRIPRSNFFSYRCDEGLQGEYISDDAAKEHVRKQQQVYAEYRKKCCCSRLFSPAPIVHAEYNPFNRPKPSYIERLEYN